MLFAIVILKAVKIQISCKIGKGKENHKNRNTSHTIH